jgi:hypothetical protein
VVYAKARPRATALPAQQDPIAVPPLPEHSQPFTSAPGAQQFDLPDCAGDAAFEQRLRMVAIPAALLLSALLLSTGFGQAVGRIFFSMWLHELGHTAAAWLCGYSALPLPWFTPVAGNRSAGVALVVASGLVWILVRLWRWGRRALAAIPVALLLAQAICTLALSRSRSEAFFTFCGDAGGMVLGAGLMATFYVGRDSQLYRGWARWGLLVIGSVAFVDPFRLWWAARSDPDRIPYGRIEGVGLSDASKLTEVYGWTEGRMVTLFVTVGVLTLVALGGLYAWGLRGPPEPAGELGPRSLED